MTVDDKGNLFWRSAACNGPASWSLTREARRWPSSPPAQPRLGPFPSNVTFGIGDEATCFTSPLTRACTASSCDRGAEATVREMKSSRQAAGVGPLREGQRPRNMVCAARIPVGKEAK